MLLRKKRIRVLLKQKGVKMNRNNSPKSTFVIAQKMDMLSPIHAKGYPISCREWNFMKSKVETIREDVNWFHTIGSALLGAAIPTLLSLITGVIPWRDESGNCTTIWIVSCSVFAVTISISIVCLLFAQKQKEITSWKSRDVLNLMKNIEDRFPSIEEPAETS